VIYLCDCSLDDLYLERLNADLLAINGAATKSILNKKVTVHFRRRRRVSETNGVEMKIVKRRLESYRAIAAAVCFRVVIAGTVLADQDKYALVAPNGIAFSEFRGTNSGRTWQ
jgi:hypothetical protein